MQSVSHLFLDVELETRVYSVCFFARDALVPEVILMDAVSDEEALSEARARRTSTMREVWQGHRLVSVIPAVR